MNAPERRQVAKTRKLIRVIAIASIVIVATFACLVAIGYWSTIPRYTTKSIPIWAYSTHNKESGIWWIDNDRVMFSGGDPNITVPGDTPDRPLQLQAIYTWNTKTNEYRREVELGPLGVLTCYENGMYQYYTSSTYDKITKQRTVKLYEAKLGEVPTERGPRPSRDGVNRGVWLMSRFGCLEGWETSLVRPTHALRHRIIHLLWPEDGYLYAPTDTTDRAYPHLMSDPAEWWRSRASTAVSLPMTVKELLTTEVFYSTFKKVYIVPAGLRSDETRPEIGGFLPGKKRPVYFFHRSGITEVKLFPSEDWVARGEGFLPTVAGYFVASRFTRRAHSLDMGAWLIERDISHKLVDHIVEEFSISPNGCKAALSIYNPDRGARLGRDMRVLDFCSQEDK